MIPVKSFHDSHITQAAIALNQYRYLETKKPSVWEFFCWGKS
uniref:Uncharacterized protein n=1 Tax=Enterovibrio norvegicus TaxID=188144 RepID=A0A0H3ZR87_9GAMM|nr:hypothetical protein [Enterovibrio norvegicus]